MRGTGQAGRRSGPIASSTKLQGSAYGTSRGADRAALIAYGLSEGAYKKYTLPEALNGPG